MERELIEEIATMKGGQGRLDRIVEKLRQKRAACVKRERELEELIALCLKLRQKPAADSVDATGE